MLINIYCQKILGERTTFWPFTATSNCGYDPRCIPRLWTSSNILFLSLRAKSSPSAGSALAAVSTAPCKHKPSSNHANLTPRIAKKKSSNREANEQNLLIAVCVGHRQRSERGGRADSEIGGSGGRFRSPPHRLDGRGIGEPQAA